MSDPLLLAGAGLAIGMAFGGVGRWSAFCVRGALEDIVAGRGVSARVVGYATALAIAVAGVQALVIARLLDPAQTVYMASVLGIGGAVVGGLAFGVGMVLAGGCGARLLVLGGGGNLRSLLVLLTFGLVAYATMRGILSPVRTAVASGGVVLAEPGMEASLASILAAAMAVDPTIVRIAAATIIVTGAIWAALRTPSIKGILGGGLIGLLVVAAFGATGIWLADEFEPKPAEGLSVTRGLGDALVYLLTWTGSTINFAISWIFGVPLGALVVALVRGDARLEGFTAPGQMLRYVAGGALMGFGGVLAAGCTIGNGLTGLALLGPSALLAFVAIIAGAVATMLLQRRRLARPAEILLANGTAG